MADRYWVGGSGTWNTTNTTNWSTTSGGTGGASVPTQNDNVYFDANSGTPPFTVSLSGTLSCAALNCSNFFGILGGTGNLTVRGDFTLSAAMSYTYGGTITFQPQATSSLNIDSAGQLIGAIIINASPGYSVSLLSAFTSSGGVGVSISQGDFNTNGYSVSTNAITFSANSSVKSLTLGNSTVTLLSATPFVTTSSSNYSINAGTSLIVCTGSVTSFAFSVASAFTLYNLSFTNTTARTLAFSSTSSYTFNRLTVAAPASAGVTVVTFAQNNTFNDGLATSGTAGNRRVRFSSATAGIAYTQTVNGAGSLTDADFRDIYVIGTAAPISGTRIGDLRGTRGITTSTPKTVYWVTAAGGNWSGNNWAATSGGAASTDNFPLAQDTATIENTGLNASATITFDTAISYTGTMDMSSRTNAMTLSAASAYQIYGDWKNGSGTAFLSAPDWQFSGRNTQTITSAGKTFSGAVTVNSYGGTVQLADALNIGANALTVTNGTFDTKNYNVTASSLSSNNSNVRTINLGSSTLTFSLTNPISISTTTNLTLNSGTSTIVINSANGVFAGSGLTWYNLNLTSTNNTSVASITGANTFNNVSISAPSAAGLTQCTFGANQTINGTLTCAGATAVRRVFVRSNTLGTTRTLTVNSLSATDCDFRDITIAGTAAGSSPTRAGDCGGNSGITFPAAKTVYWNLAGTSAWTDTGWASSSGGTPAVNNFPLAQDTAVFDNTGAVGTVSMSAGINMGSIDMSGRTSAMTLNMNASNIYGSWTFGTGVTTSSTTLAPIFSGRGTQTITSNGVTFGCPLTVDCFTGTVQLADALTLGSTRTLTLTSGTFDAVSYNVTTGLMLHSGTAFTLKMGTGTWTLSGTGTVWFASTNLVLYKGSANIVLSDTSTTARTITGGGYSYNKITIGGATGTSTTTFGNNDQYTEIASTKTVAHTIALGTTTPTYGAWTVTGTAGNVVTVSGTATISIAGARVTGVDYLALGTTTISATSPGEFYAGANSTGGTNAILTAAPAAVTRYWVGGTGTWSASSTTNWSATSGGAGGASVPTSADAVVFDSASNATAYTVTCTATQLRCASLTMAGPASGNVTWAGTAPLAIHDNVSLSATGITRTYTGGITLSGSATGKTFTTNGNTLASATTVNGVGSGWSLGSAFNNGSSTVALSNGAFDSAGYNITCGSLNTAASNTRTLSFGASTISASGTITLGTTTAELANLTFNCGTSQINATSTAAIFSGNNQTFYNVDFTGGAAGTVTINGANTFNNLSFSGPTVAGLNVVSITAGQTINGTLTLSAGANATCRTFLQSDTLGTTRTLTCAAFSGTDADFRDITIAGAAAPVSGTRLGDCKGNSGITFGAGVSRYWNLAGNNNWSATGWAASSGASPAVNNFPLAQDTAVFESGSPASGSTITINAAYNIGTIDMSARTSNTMTLATGTTTPAIYGNWINGTGTTLTGTGAITFAGRGSQTITSAGKTFTQPFTINSPGGSVTLTDALTNSRTASAIQMTAGTFSDGGYNVTLTDTASGFNCTSSTSTRSVSINGTLTIAGTNGWVTSGITGLSVTGTGTISLTSASAKTFAGGGASYSSITLNQGGAGALTITGNNTFKDITNSYSATGATNITIGTTTQTVSQWTATGASGKVLTVQGTSASSPGTLILSGATDPNVDYLAVTGVRAYSLIDTWYAGANSTNNGSLGWYFSASTPVVAYTGNFFFFM